MTLIEIVVIIVIGGILAAILYPALRPRPARFYTAIVPPQHFKNAELQTVVAQLDKALQASRAKQGKKPVPYLQASWQTESLKKRLVSLDTQEPLPLKEVLAKLEKTAHIKIDYGGWCGTCGSPMGRARIIDTLKATNKQQNKALHPTAYSFARRSSSLRLRRRVSLAFYCLRAAWLCAKIATKENQGES